MDPQGGGSAKSELDWNTNFFSGAAAAVAARTVTSPLDVARTVSQVGAPHHDGFLGTLHHMRKEGGLKALFRGNLTGCLRIVPFSYSQFLTSRAAEDYLASSGREITPWTKFGVGAIGGSAATLVVHPFDVVKTKLTVQPTASASREYSGMLNCFRKVAVEKGPLEFYRGSSMAVLLNASRAGVMWQLRGIVPGTLWQRDPSELTDVQIFMSGTVASAIAHVATHPIDTIRQRLYAGKRGSAAFSLSGIWQGNLATLLRVLPYNAVLLFTFDTMVAQIRRSGLSGLASNTPKGAAPQGAPESSPKSD